jgi:dTDP-4-amino-4,6-dideoxygalactose transaminase
MDRVKEFEQTIAKFYNAPYAVAVDCCTHAIELCLRLEKKQVIVSCPKHTYLSVPMTLKKLGMSWLWSDEQWKDYYYIGKTNIIDAAVHWERNGYVPGTLMCLSFQFKKHLNVGRGGMILLDNEEQYKLLRKMRYDGREDDVPWAEQDIDSYGYHYYMTPETAQTGTLRFTTAEVTKPRKWSWQDYPDLSKMKVFSAE